MKSSTLHRSNLSKERMSMIENIKQQPYRNVDSELNQYIKMQKSPEIDILWRGFEKNLQTKTGTKAPIVYAGIGFVLGLIFALGIALIIGVSTYGDMSDSEYRQVRKIEDPQTKVSILPSDSNTTNEQAIPAGAEEKYTVKSGDTLDKIAVRFYGRYDNEKIEQIKKLNNIKDETTIQIGQVLIIPLN